MFISTHPKTLITSLLAAIAAGFMISSNAAAQNVLLSLESIEVDQTGYAVSTRSSSILLEHDNYACKYIGAAKPMCRYIDIRPEFLVATYGVMKQADDKWTVEVEVRLGEIIYASKTLKLSSDAGDELKVDIPTGYEIYVAAVINDDPSLKNPILPQFMDRARLAEMTHRAQE